MARKVFTISMPDEMYESLVNRLSRTRYASVSEYIRDLIRRDGPGDAPPGQTKSPEADSHSKRESPFVIKTANEWLQERVEKYRGSG